MTYDEIDLPELETGKYLHTKTGHMYTVVGVAMATETDEPMVVYAPLWDCKYRLFVRPYAMFVEVVIIDGKAVQRFQKIKDD